MNILYFNNNIRGLYYKKLTLGDDLEVTVGSKVFPNCRFIKVTRKGFNILNLDTDRVILKKHTYAKGMSNKEYAKQGTITGEFIISVYIRIKVKQNTNQKVS